jgi:hypothetical protein
MSSEFFLNCFSEKEELLSIGGESDFIFLVQLLRVVCLVSVVAP